MARRLIYFAENKFLGVRTIEIEFQWYSGMSLRQKQKSIENLHMRIKEKGYEKILEISSKSLQKLGVELSAFNLKTNSIRNNIQFTVETAFQSSKVFEKGGPYKDLLYKRSIEAKKDPRIRNSGNLIGFNFFNIDFEPNPLTFFYDWLYINVLLKNSNLCDKICEYDIFTDIEFNPNKSVNCQAFSAALFVSINRNKIDYNDLKDPYMFRKITKNVYEDNLRNQQSKLILK